MSAHSRGIFVAGLFGVILLVLAVQAPSFYQLQPLLSLGAREAPTLITVCGMALIIIARQVDISIGSQFAVCGVAAGLLASINCPTSLVWIAAIGFGATLGALNGLLVAGLQLPSIVVTLGMMVTLREALRLVRQGEFVPLPDDLQWLGLSQSVGQWLLVLFAVGLLATVAIGMRFVFAGRLVYALGSAAEAARLAGLRPRLITFATFVFMGALTGLAAMMNVIQSPQVDPKMGTGLELKSIAAAVVGGVAISGGRGSLWGALAGFLLLTCIGPALIHLHVEAYWERAIQGGVILLAVLADGMRGRVEPE